MVSWEFEKTWPVYVHMWKKEIFIRLCSNSTDVYGKNTYDNCSLVFRFTGNKYHEKNKTNIEKWKKSLAQ